LPLLAAAVFAAPALYPADVFRAGDLSAFAYQPAFHHETFAPHYGYIAPSHRFVDLAVAQTPYPATPITQYVHHHSIQVPVAPAPQIKYVQVPVPTPVIHVVPEVKTVVITKVVEKVPAPAPAPARTTTPAPAPARTPAPAPAPAPVQIDSRESAESVEIDSRED
jgi:hypothetical protein